MYNLRWIFILLFLFWNVNIAKAIEQTPPNPESIILETSITEDGLSNSTPILSTAKKEAPVFLDIIKDGLQLEGSIIKEIKLGIYYDSVMNFTDDQYDGFSSRFNMSAIEPYMRIKLRDDKTEFMAKYNTIRNLDDYTNHFSYKISEICISRKINENQKIVLGQGARLPVGIDGSSPQFHLDTVMRTQIGRTFSNVVSVGIRNQAKYKYLDYDIGVYDSTRFFQDLFEGVDFTGWVNFKPLANFEDKYGRLTIGTGCNVGDYRNSYSVWGGYLGYDYKRFHTKFEYALADGYNGVVNSSNKAEGFYNTILYDLTPSIQLIARYDYLNPDKSLNSVSATEYTTGIAYKYKNNIRIHLNYVYRDREQGSNQNLIMIATRFLI